MRCHTIKLPVWVLEERAKSGNKLEHGLNQGKIQYKYSNKTLDQETDIEINQSKSCSILNI